MNMLSTTLFLALSTASAASAAEPEATPRRPDSAFQVTVTLTEPKGSERRPVFEAKVQIIDDHGCSKVEARGPTVDHEVEVCREGGTDARPIFGLKITRFLRGEADDRRSVRMTAALAPGKRASIGRIANAAGVLEIETQVELMR